jgi:hypothetical protein
MSRREPLQRNKALIVARPAIRAVRPARPPTRAQAFWNAVEAKAWRDVRDQPLQAASGPENVPIPRVVILARVYLRVPLRQRRGRLTTIVLGAV